MAESPCIIKLNVNEQLVPPVEIQIGSIVTTPVAAHADLRSFFPGYLLEDI